MEDKALFFKAIKEGDGGQVRSLLSKNKDLIKETIKDPSIKFDPELELDAYKFLGAYLGSLTGLQLALLIGQDSVAKDILDSTFSENIDHQMGGGNTALHLATFLGAKDIVVALLQRGAKPTIKNSKGFTAVDIVSGDKELQEVFENLINKDD